MHCGYGEIGKEWDRRGRRGMGPCPFHPSVRLTRIWRYLTKETRGKFIAAAAAKLKDNPHQED